MKLGPATIAAEGDHCRLDDQDRGHAFVQGLRAQEHDAERVADGRGDGASQRQPLLRIAAAAGRAVRRDDQHAGEAAGDRRHRRPADFLAQQQRAEQRDEDRPGIGDGKDLGEGQLAQRIEERGARDDRQHRARRVRTQPLAARPYGRNNGIAAANSSSDTA